MAHQWILIAVGRVCLKCSKAQVKGDFDDDEPCKDDKPYVDEAPQSPMPETPEASRRPTPK